MQTSRWAVLKSLIVVGTFALASLPVSAQLISADAVKNGHFPEALRGHLDRSPDKSIHPCRQLAVRPAAAPSLRLQDPLPRRVPSSPPSSSRVRAAAQSTMAL